MDLDRGKKTEAKGKKNLYQPRSTIPHRLPTGAELAYALLLQGDLGQYVGQFGR